MGTPGTGVKCKINTPYESTIVSVVCVSVNTITPVITRAQERHEWVHIKLLGGKGGWCEEKFRKKKTLDQNAQE